MQEFKVKNGSFVVNDYTTKALNVQGRDGCKIFSCVINVEFLPKIGMATEDRVCLIQAVKDEMVIKFLETRTSNAKIISTKNQREENQFAGFSERLSNNNWAIDQTIYDKSGNVINLDPRYVEQRLLNISAYRDHSDCEKGIIGYSQNYIYGDKDHTEAILTDEPNAVYGFAKRSVPTGEQQFEIVAMLDKSNGEKEYIASLKWGWKIEGDKFIKEVYTPILSTTEIKVSDTPSKDFIEAAKRWNDMVCAKMGRELSINEQKIGLLPLTL